MKLRRFGLSCIIAQSLALVGWGQQPATEDPKAATIVASPAGEKSRKLSVAADAGHLHTDLVELASEIAEVFQEPLRCDADGNLYLRTDPSGAGAIRKLDSKGEKVAILRPSSSNIKVNRPLSFAIAADGDVYQLISALEVTRYVFVYNKDGGVKSEIKLQPGFPFFPKHIAVFSNGDMLISGMKYDEDRRAAMWPFTGIFAPDGTLRRELDLKDDQKIHDMAASGDPKVTLPEMPSANRAISGGAAETGLDGNVYLMRKLSPAIIYAISPGGSVRRFEVDPGQPDFLPTNMHVGGDRIAVLFWEPQTHDEILKVVDLHGRKIATYNEAAEKGGGHALGLAFICYAQNPERFTFLETMDANRLGLITAAPQ